MKNYENNSLQINYVLIVIYLLKKPAILVGVVVYHVIQIIS